MNMTQILPLLHWLTDLSLEADGAKSLSIRGFQDEVLGNHFGHLSDQCIHVRTHLLTTRCSQEQQARFWQQRITAVFQPLPETYLFHREELDTLRLKITPTSPLYKVRLLGKVLDLFYDLSSFETAVLYQVHDEELYGEGTRPLFDAYYATRNVIKGDKPEDWDEIHDALDRFASSRSSWKTRWIHFTEDVANVHTTSDQPSEQDDIYIGEVDVELTGLAAMRQRRTMRLEEPLPQSAVEDLARKTAGNHVWDYQGMQDATIEVTMLNVHRKE